MSTLKEHFEKEVKYLSVYSYQSQDYVAPLQGDNFSYSDIENSPTKANSHCRAILMPNLLSYGDYDNSCHVERSNHRVFMKEFGKLLGIWEISGSYGSNSIAIDIELHNENEEIIDTLISLENYPCIDEEDCSLMESELIKETWDNCYSDDFIRAIDETYNTELYGNEYDKEKLFQIFEDIRDSVNEYWEIQSGGIPYISIDKIIESTDLKKVFTCFDLTAISGILAETIEKLQDIRESIFDITANQHTITGVYNVPENALISILDNTENAINGISFLSE